MSDDKNARGKLLGAICGLVIGVIARTERASAQAARRCGYGYGRRGGVCREYVEDVLWVKVCLQLRFVVIRSVIGNGSRECVREFIFFIYGKVTMIKIRKFDWSCVKQWEPFSIKSRLIQKLSNFR